MSLAPRPLLAAGLLLGTAIAAPASAQTNMMQFAQAFPATDGKDVGASEIVVDSADGGRYDKVRTETIDLWVRLTLNKGTGADKIEEIRISAEGATIKPREWTFPPTPISFSTTRWKLSFPYVHPRSGTVGNQRNSPIDTCNARLDALSGAAKEQFRKNGARIDLVNAYAVRARAITRFWWDYKNGRYTRLDSPRDYQDDDIQAKVTVVCKPLDAPRPRTETSTQGVPGRPGKRLEPTISEAELRIEPVQVIAVGGQSCPSQLRLYGRVQAIRAFSGKAVIFGAGYFSPVTALEFPKGGNRNFIATYPLRWDKLGGLAAQPGGLKSQTVSLTMNVTSQDNTVLKQAQETVSVTCKAIASVAPLDLGGTGRLAVKPKPDDPDRPVVLGRLWNGPEAGEPRPVRVKRTSPAGFFVTRGGAAALLPGVDASIRSVDRRGPGGATRLFVRNGGTEAGATCRVYAKRDVYNGWIEIGSTQLQTGRTSTVQFSGALPNDPNLTFAVDCVGEPDDRLDDNVATLP